MEIAKFFEKFSKKKMSEKLFSFATTSRLRESNDRGSQPISAHHLTGDILTPYSSFINVKGDVKTLLQLSQKLVRSSGKCNLFVNWRNSLTLSV